MGGEEPLAEEPTRSIDRSSYVPAYAQLAQILRAQIAAGRFRPGDRLPSESQLCRQYGVSPMTVRRAVNLLVDQGLVTAEQGRGTFVRPLDLETASFNLDNLQRLFRGREHASVRLLEARIVSATERIGRMLGIRPNERAVFIRRLILQEEKPIVLHREYLIYDPTRPIVEAELEVTALHGLFSGGSSSTLKRGELAIEATVLTDEEANLLESRAGAPAFRLEHIFYDLRDRPVSWGWFICPGDRLRFTTAVGIRGERISQV